MRRGSDGKAGGGRVGAGGGGRLPGLRPTNERADWVAVSDVHLWDHPPISRSAEPDWLAAVARVLMQVDDLRAEHRAGVLYAGDVFDRWKASPNLIRFAIEHLPPGYAVPGQHDLPYHSFEDRHKTGYGVLVQAGVLTELPVKTPLVVERKRRKYKLYGFPWGLEVHPIGGRVDPADDHLYVAVAHQYVWTKECSYRDRAGNLPPTSSRLKAIREKCAGFDVAVFGDNHLGFLSPGKDGQPTILNNGTLLRRTSKEVDYRPAVGLIYPDGRVDRHFLDCSADVFATPDEIVTRLEAAGAGGSEEFLDELKALGDAALDYGAAVRAALAARKDLSPGARDGVLRVLEDES